MTASIVGQSYDRVAQEQKGRSITESAETPYRAFNNFVKRSLITRFLDELRRRGGGNGGVVAMDLGAGRGGDLPKWIFLQSPSHPEAKDALFVTRLFHYDVSPVSIEEATRRFELLLAQCRHAPPVATFGVADVLGDPNGFWGDTVVAAGVPQESVDVVSMQFCLHYGCATEELLRSTLRGICGVLKQHGSVLLTIVDSEELVRRLVVARQNHVSDVTTVGEKMSKDDRLQWTGVGPARILFGSEWNSVFQACDCTVGLPYHFSLTTYVDATEYSLPLEALIRVACDVGLSFVTSAPFGGGMLNEFLSNSKNLAKFNLEKAAQFPRGDLEVINLYRTVVLTKK